MTEYQWDKKLKIDTIGRDDYHADNFRYPYEPTPYSVLERLSESGYITSKSILVDYGCGKGRVSFFMSSILQCRSIGIEYDEPIFRQSMENKSTFSKPMLVDFFCENAENFKIEDADSFYFFNPFDIKILTSVLGQIKSSFYSSPRKMYLFFYYPNDDYVAHLMTDYELTFVEEIDCHDLFEVNNKREKIMIFEISAE